MFIDEEKCIGCGLCRLYCPISAITLEDRKASISYEKCTECGNCKRSGVCNADAIRQQHITGVRRIRSLMSNVRTVYKGINGRGTEEMKTNDVTGRYVEKMCGIAVELGRPGISASVRDVEKVAKVVAAHGGVFEENNPIDQFIVNKETGDMNPDYLDERIMSGIVECKLDINRLIEMVNALKKVSEEIDTVFSLDVVSLVDKDGSLPTRKLLDEAGIYYRPNGKTNIGLGKPAFFANRGEE